MADDSEQTEEPDEAQLEELEEHIQKARAHADDAIDAFSAEPKESYADSGSEDRDEDDQTITPPG